VRPPTARPRHDNRLTTAIVLGCFVLLFGALSISSLLQKSPTFDEPAHLLSGYSYLKWADWRPNPEHPPFAKIWAAMPLLAFDLKDPRPSRPHWDRILDSSLGYSTNNVAEDLLFVDNDGETLFLLAKLQIVLLGMLLGAFVFVWARELFGLAAATVALLLYTFDPNVLAHSQIVHTDVPFAAFFFIGTYWFWHALHRLTWLNLVCAALFFALCAITKYSYPVIVLVWAALGAMRVFASEPFRLELTAPCTLSGYWRKAMVVVGILAAAAVATYGVTWAAYGFRYDAVPGGARPMAMAQVMPSGMPVVTALATFAASHRLFPEAWLYGQLYTLNYLTRPSYLLGSISGDGFLAYFPIAIAVKTPLPALILLVWSVVAWATRRARMTGLFLLVPVAIHFLVAVSSHMNIGLRHILPIYPFLFVLLGGSAVLLWQGGGVWARRCLALLAVWQLASCLAAYPHYLAYFNELAGGSQNGHRVLLDSNVDWGQDLKGLKRWMDANHVKKVQFLYFGYVDPEYYGIDAVYPSGNRWLRYDPPATQSKDAPEYVVVSANILYASRIFLDASAPAWSETEAFLRSLRAKRPIASIGYSLYVYRID